MKPRAALFLHPALLLFLCAVAAPARERNAVVIQADFGGAVMPGVVFSASKELPVFTIQPLIELYNIDEASRNLMDTAPYWPAGTVFVSVVDPGVGTKRKSVVLKTKSGHFFVSPDNGTLSVVAEELGIEAVREIDEKINRRPGTGWSHTFHGHDVYAYTAGRLAAGVITYEQVGPLLEPKVVTLDYPKPVFKDGTVTGTIYVSRGLLGNTAAIIDLAAFRLLGAKEGDRLVATIRHLGKTIWEETVPYVRTFGDVPVGQLLLFINDAGYTSLAINQSNFAHTYNIDSGRDWSLTLRKK